MSEELRMWVEIAFNIIYLVVIWSLVFVLWIRRSELTGEYRRQGNLVIAAFGLLAFGDSGHVGFRVWAYALGGLESTVPFLGRPLSLVGLGALMTAVTVTLFYVVLLELWRARFKQRYGWFQILLLAAAVVRLIWMSFPVNAWESVVPPQPWSTIRNIPLMLQGLGVAYLILRDGRRFHDRAFQWIGVSILVSFACYLPVILFVQQIPIIGMLMIPKTLAYVAIGFLAYRDLFPVSSPRQKSSMAPL